MRSCYVLLFATLLAYMLLNNLAEAKGGRGGSRSRYSSGSGGSGGDGMNALKILGIIIGSVLGMIILCACCHICSGNDEGQVQPPIPYEQALVPVAGAQPETVPDQFDHQTVPHQTVPHQTVPHQAPVQPSNGYPISNTSYIGADARHPGTQAPQLPYNYGTPNTAYYSADASQAIAPYPGTVPPQLPYNYGTPNTPYGADASQATLPYPGNPYYSADASQAPYNFGTTADPYTGAAAPPLPCPYTTSSQPEGNTPSYPAYGASEDYATADVEDSTTRLLSNEAGSGNEPIPPSYNDCIF